MSRRSIAFVCQVFYPDSQSTSQLFTDLFARLVKENYEVTAICSYPAGARGETHAEVPGREIHEGIRIERTGIHLNYKKHLVLRAIYYASYLLGATWKLIRHRRDDIIFGVTNPPFTPVWLWLMHLVFRSRYQIMLLDVFPDGLVALGDLKESSLINRLWRWANRRAFARADKIIVLGRDMGDLAHESYGTPREKIEYIPHWSVMDVAEPKRAEETRLWQELGLRDEFVVQYSGNMGLWHDMNSLVLAAERLKERPDIKFLFIGGGIKLDAARKLAEEKGLDNIIWLPFQPKENLDDSLSCCHLSIISQRDGLQGIAVPCKLYGILASGRGILGMVPEGTEVSLVIEEEACGVRHDPTDSAALADSIVRLAQNREEVSAMGRRAFEAYTGKYTLDQACHAFENLWGKL